MRLRAPALLRPLAATIALALAAVPAAGVEPPATLAETGLYADAGRLEVDPGHLPFAPQYPLWTDGAAKRRWIALPPGTAIDAADPDAWVFPVGTRIWKEFAFDGRPVETRYLERLPDGEWLYAAYEWDADGRAATLVPARGRRGVHALGEGRAHAIPSVSDCKVCHAAGPGRVLGFSALQLSPDRDPGAPHAEPATGVDLVSLIEAGLIAGYPAAAAPRIAAASATERAALGYLHGNCGHCHRADARLANLGLFLGATAEGAGRAAVATTVGRPVRAMAPGQPAEAVLRIAAGHPERSAVVQRMGSRYAALQMPPLGTELVDREALALVEQWIAELEAKQAQPGTEGEVR